MEVEQEHGDGSEQDDFLFQGPARQAHAAPWCDVSAGAQSSQCEQDTCNQASAGPSSPCVGWNAASSAALHDGGVFAGAGQLTSQGGVMASASPTAQPRDAHSRRSTSSTSIVDAGLSPGTTQTTASRARGLSGASIRSGSTLSRRSSTERAAGVLSRVSQTTTSSPLPGAGTTLPASAARRRAGPAHSDQWPLPRSRLPGCPSPAPHTEEDDALWGGPGTGIDPAEAAQLEQCGDGELFLLASHSYAGTVTASAADAASAVAAAAAAASAQQQRCVPAAVAEEEEQQLLHPQSSALSSYTTSAASSTASSPSPPPGRDASPRGPLPPSAKRGAFSPQRPSRSMRKSAKRGGGGTAADGAAGAQSGDAAVLHPALTGERCENPMSSAIAGEESQPTSPVPHRDCVEEGGEEGASGELPPPLALGDSHDGVDSFHVRALIHGPDQALCPLNDRSQCALHLTPTTRVSRLCSVQEAASQEEDDDDDEEEDDEDDEDGREGAAPGRCRTLSQRRSLGSLYPLNQLWDSRQAGVDGGGPWAAQYAHSAGSDRVGVDSAVGSDACGSLASADMGDAARSPYWQGDHGGSAQPSSWDNEGAASGFEIDSAHQHGQLSPGARATVDTGARGDPDAAAVTSTVAQSRLVTVDEISPRRHACGAIESLSGSWQDAVSDTGGLLAAVDAATAGSGAGGSRPLHTIESLLGEGVQWRAAQHRLSESCVDREEHYEGHGGIVSDSLLHRGVAEEGEGADAGCLDCALDELHREDGRGRSSLYSESPIMADPRPQRTTRLAPAARDLTRRRARRRPGSTHVQRAASRTNLKRSRSITHAELNLDQEGVDPEFDAAAAAQDSAALEQQVTCAAPRGVARPTPSLPAGTRTGAASASQAVSAAAVAGQSVGFDAADAFGSSAEASGPCSRAGHGSARSRVWELSLGRRTRRRSVSGATGTSPVMRPRARSARPGDGDASVFFHGVLSSPQAASSAAARGQGAASRCEGEVFALGTPRRAASRASFAPVPAARQRSASATVWSASDAQDSRSPGNRPQTGLPRLVIPSPKYV